MRDDWFEWDDRKAATNLARHGVRFEVARLAFEDPNAVGRVDAREDYGEERYIMLGIANNRLLHVAFALRGERVRIISARPAEPRERRRYHEGNG
jgi:uncharacterized DUF497 family protein